MSLFTLFGRDVLKKDGGFSWTELVKRNPCTSCLIELPAAQAWLYTQAEDQDFSPTLSFPPFSNVCPRKCPSSPNSCTDRLGLPLLSMAKGKRQTQSVTDSLPTWQSRRVQLECSYCFLCSVCNGISVARFPIHAPSGLPSLQQLSQLLNSNPYDIL